MTGLLTYSGLTTKVKAMEGRLITEDGFREMASLEKVSDTLEYLKSVSSYQEIFAGTDASLHRGEIEQLLILSKYRDFTKLYRFSRISQRKFLDLYFLHYEIAVLKRCLRSILNHQKVDLDLSLFQDFFEKHSKLNLKTLAAAETLPDFISALNGSCFYDLLNRLADNPDVSLPDYEWNMDLLYFKTMWKALKKQLSKQEEKILIQCFGARLDLLNIQWIYRSIKYYRLPSTDIYALLIPIHYRLKPDEIKKMADAASPEEFLTALRSTFYGSLSPKDLGTVPNLDRLYENVLNRAHRITRQKDPYSIASLNSYLYFKELEIQKIITVIEGVRYGMGADTICSLIMGDQSAASPLTANKTRR